MNEALVERILLAVEQIPPGRVASYGEIGSLVGCGPRYVGMVMARWGGGVPWWRVTSADGDPPKHLLAEVKTYWDREAIQVKRNGRGCDIGIFGADLDALAAAVDRALGVVPGSPDEPAPPGHSGLFSS